MARHGRDAPPGMLDTRDAQCSKAATEMLTSATSDRAEPGHDLPSSAAP